MIEVVHIVLIGEELRTVALDEGAVVGHMIDVQVGADDGPHSEAAAAKSIQEFFAGPAAGVDEDDSAGGELVNAYKGVGHVRAGRMAGDIGP